MVRDELEEIIRKDSKGNWSNYIFAAGFDFIANKSTKKYKEFKKKNKKLVFYRIENEYFFKLTWKNKEVKGGLEEFLDTVLKDRSNEEIKEFIQRSKKESTIEVETDALEETSFLKDFSNFPSIQEKATKFLTTHRKLSLSVMEPYLYSMKSVIEDEDNYGIAVPVYKVEDKKIRLCGYEQKTTIWKGRNIGRKRFVLLVPHNMKCHGVVISESIFDAFAYCQAKNLNGYILMSISGKINTKEIIEALEIMEDTLQHPLHYLLAFDGDKKGKIYTLKMSEELLKKGKSYCVNIPPEGFKDWNDYIKAEKSSNETIPIQKGL